MTGLITSHVLDIALGQPARDVVVRLEVQQDAGTWKVLAARMTGADGRVGDLLAGTPLEARTYRLTFEIGSYLRAAGRASFYPRVEITFEVAEPTQHHHVPLLVSPFGYSTYRGS
jgi:5-hydroxyisourate hydrolase